VADYERSPSEEAYEVATQVECLLKDSKVPWPQLVAVVRYACRYLRDHGRFDIADKVALEAVIRGSPVFKEAAPYAKELAEAVYKVCGQGQSPELKPCVASPSWGRGELSPLSEEVEMTAARLATEYLVKMGYSVAMKYRRGPGPYDMVVSKDGERYTVEVKGRRVPKSLWDERLCESISFTENEVQYLDSRRDRHIICIVYIGDEGQREVNCVTPDEFEKRWERVHDVNAEREGRHVFRGRGCGREAEDLDE
jgi:hypothetical protein